MDLSAFLLKPPALSDSFERDQTNEDDGDDDDTIGGRVLIDEEDLEAEDSKSSEGCEASNPK